MKGTEYRHNCSLELDYEQKEKTLTYSDIGRVLVHWPLHSALWSSLFGLSRVEQLTDCFIEIGCVNEWIGRRAYSEGFQHSENVMGRIVLKQSYRKQVTVTQFELVIDCIYPE